MNPRMTDPLSSFDWQSLDSRYDANCKKYDSSMPFLNVFDPHPRTDRELYAQLVERLPIERSTRDGVGLAWYEAMLYWKLYSQPAAIANVCERLRTNALKREATQRALTELSLHLPKEFDRDAKVIREMAESFTDCAPYGMVSDCAIAVRATLLHFTYPDAVPLFDKMVLQAVGVGDKGANQNYSVFESYVSFAWELEARYIENLRTFAGEYPLRVLDRALWVTRGK